MNTDRESLLFLDKSFDTLMTETLNDLKSTPINNTGPGGVARLILARVNKHLADFYKAFQVNHAQAFLSKATGDSLDMVGEILNCSRRTNESDDDYKYRIHTQTLSLEKANETAIRLAALSIPGVKDVVMRPFTHGTGSFSVYVLTDDPMPSDTLIEQVKLIIEETKGYGIRAEVFRPRLSPVELRLRLAFDQKTGDIDKTLVRNRAIEVVRHHLNTLKPGSVLSVKELTSKIMKLSDSILDVEIYHFTIKERPMLLVNQESAWNERFIESSNPSAILVS